ncbi:hypothetical protein IAU59_003295 [Kwoniella sp. CBS 9459]
MFIPDTSALVSFPERSRSRLDKRLTSAFPGGANSGGLRTPLKIFIPVFAAFFTLVLLAVLVPKLRQCYVHDQLRSAERRVTKSRSRPSPRVGEPFEIDGPTVTPFPAPHADPNPPAVHTWTHRVDPTPPRVPSPTPAGNYPWTPRVPERAHTNISTRQITSSAPVVQVIPPAYSFISSPQAEAERNVPASATNAQMGGLERPASDIPRIHSPAEISSTGSVLGAEAPPQYESVVSPIR